MGHSHSACRCDAPPKRIALVLMAGFPTSRRLRLKVMGDNSFPHLPPACGNGDAIAHLVRARQLRDELRHPFGIGAVLGEREFQDIDGYALLVRAIRIEPTQVRQLNALRPMHFLHGGDGFRERSSILDHVADDSKLARPPLPILGQGQVQRTVSAA